MTKNINLSDASHHIFRDSDIWNTLSGFLIARVRYWVYSAHIALWDSKEEEIAGDIIQDAIIGTLRYILYHSRINETEFVLTQPFLKISAAIAYQYYKAQEWRDSRFVPIRLRNMHAQECASVEEQTFSQETALASAEQEWYYECLAGTIMKIPRSLRKALLVQLANYVHPNSQPARFLLNAFLRRNVHLENYKRFLPHSPRARYKHRALLELAYRQVIKEQKQEHDALIAESQNFLLMNTWETEMIEHDIVIRALMQRLKETAPRTRPDLAFRARLREKVLDRMIEHQIRQTLARHAEQIEEQALPFFRHLATEGQNQNYERSTFDPYDPDDFETWSSQHNDLELTAFSTYLESKTPLASIDPVFRETLREKLKGIPLLLPTARPPDNALHETEKLLGQLPPEDYLLTNNTDDPDSMLHEREKSLEQSSHVDYFSFDDIDDPDDAFDETELLPKQLWQVDHLSFDELDDHDEQPGQLPEQSGVSRQSKSRTCSANQ